MKKITTVFVRDWEGTVGPPGRFVLDIPHPDCSWMFAGEGVATRKLDGTCCLVRDGLLWKRHEVKPDKHTGVLPEKPEGFEEIDRDFETGALLGWLPVGEGTEDRWHREARDRVIAEAATLADGTYELVGPKINGNPESHSVHDLIPHSSDVLEINGDAAPPRSFLPLRAWLDTRSIEGIVWHHPDGRMGKIKKKDFGLKR